MMMYHQMNACFSFKVKDSSYYHLFGDDMRPALGTHMSFF
jgi:hypothetical protein